MVKDVMTKFMSLINHVIIQTLDMFKQFSKQNKSLQDNKKFSSMTEAQ